ncbi:DMT family transporter [Thiofilum flexile]|uniref:DMT family transporter n=1 Tax=Thiofilum flexile TaxID=125627 RepID=UPI00036180E3|nr:EamA family transporter [Thiofilum flexile]
MSHIQKNWIANIVLLLVAIFWGTSYGIAKESIAYYSVMGFLAIRFILTFFILLPFILKSKKQERYLAINIGSKLGLILLLIFICETYGVFYTTASNAAFLISLFIIFTPVMEWFLMRKKPNKKLFLASGFSVVGVFLLTYKGTWSFNVGDILIIVAAILRALMVCATKILTKNQYVSALNLTAIQSGVVGLGSLFIAIIFNPYLFNHLPNASVFWLNTLYLVLFCTIFAFFAQNWAVQYTSPTHTALLMGTEPLFGALFAALWLHEQLGLLAWVGGLIIVLTCIWLVGSSKTITTHT